MADSLHFQSALKHPDPGTPAWPDPAPSRSRKRRSDWKSATGGRSGHTAAHPLRSNPGSTGIAYLLRSRLTEDTALCYGARLSTSRVSTASPSTFVLFFRTIFAGFCHELCLVPIVLWSSLAYNLGAQTFEPSLPAPPQPVRASPNVNQKVAIPHANAPAQGLVDIESVTQEKEGSTYHLRGAVRVETSDMLLKADELDWDEDTGEVNARGHVHFEHYTKGEKVDCDRADYNINDETGKFYEVVGTSPAQITARPGLLTSTNPYYFKGEWAERLKDHYILHNGFLTDCIVPRPWWILKGPVFDVVPGDHAIARRSWFYLRRVPIFYTPYFYKSLKKEGRRSGILVPNFIRDSLHGEGASFGYFWAINRSYDLTYRGEYYSNAGLANNVEFRGPGRKDRF